MEALLTVRCLCFNHSKYLREALDGIVNQKTDFPFMVIIHDDASTDVSQDIILEYMKRYPEIIKPILQQENQYSKGIAISKTFIEPLIESKYVAVCECDDYWIDCNKLQKQVDYLEGHPECSLCCHAFDTVDSQGNFRYHDGLFSSGNHDISIDDVILNNMLPQLATVVYRQEYRQLTPDFYFNAMVGDYPLYLFMATKGTIHYLDYVMSCYRRHGNNSWVTRMQKNPMIFRQHVNMLIELVENFDESTGYKYHQISETRISISDFRALCVERDVKGILKNSYFISISFTKKIKTIINIIIPNVFTCLRKIYWKMKEQMPTAIKQMIYNGGRT